VNADYRRPGPSLKSIFAGPVDWTTALARAARSLLCLKTGS